MAINNDKTQVMNNALRMVGSYHLESNDTTSTTYQIADRAFDDAVNTIFSQNIFQYNTRRVYSASGTATTTLTDANNPNEKWSYRHSLSFSGPQDKHRYVTLLKVTDKSGNNILDWHLDNSRAEDSGTQYEDVPHLFTTEKEVHIYYSFVPNADANVLTDAGQGIRFMPPHLAVLVATLMASNMAIELSGSETRADLLYQRYLRDLRRARVIEGRGSPAQQYINDTNSSFIGAIKGYGKV